MNAAVAQAATPPTDYKALVCIFLYGGNDANNLVIPTNSSPGATDPNSYDYYSNIRGLLALPNVGATGGVLPITPANNDGIHTYGLHPQCSGIQSLFAAGKLAFVCNVGTLVGPINQLQYINRTAAVPPQLFSHNDQQIQWQTSVPDQPSRTGWGGRCADLLNSLNNSPSVSMSISLAGANTYEVGNVVNAYNVSTSGGVTLTNLNAARQSALQALLTMPHPNLFEDAFATITNRAINNAALVNSAVANVTVNTTFPATSLGNQLKMIAKLIGAHTTLNHNRQIFFCSVGGYDTHGAQLAAQNSLFNELSGCLNSFYNATVELGVEPNVTTFTSSDFSRTFPFNGDGTDHAWGSHQMAMGGSVIGGKFYGTFPNLQVAGPSDTATNSGATGRWIPTTAVDQFSATLAKWFGVQASDMATVFPNIGRFGGSDLGFMM
jgi:uncharacterized protein (DUF1501 family)